jgi:hypothetical protein
MAERDPRLGERKNRPTADEDFAAWIHHQVDALKAGRFDELDAEDLADEVESLAKRDFRMFVSAIRIILLHMLKWDYQREKRGESWRESIREHRRRVVSELKSSPSFEPRIEEAMDRAYALARIKASQQTKVFQHLFPETCPYDWQEIMNRLHELDTDWSYPEDLID